MTDYREVNERLRSLIEGVPHRVANLANAAALLWESLEDINWAGFYLREGETLILGPFQGKPACIEIPMGRGVCGAAAARGETLCVPNVHLFEGHIACDSASNSEIVVPLFGEKGVVGVLDIDSPSFDRFTDADREGLEKFAETVSSEIFGGK